MQFKAIYKSPNVLELDSDLTRDLKEGQEVFIELKKSEESKEEILAKYLEKINDEYGEALEKLAK